MRPSTRTGLVRGVAWGVAALLCLGGYESAWGFGFNVEPARVQLSVPAGKRRGQTLKVKNAKPDAPIHVTIYTRDVVHLPDGTHEFPPVGSTEWSCADWIQVVPDELDIPPSSSQEVRVSVVAPADAQGGHYAMIFFETSPSYAEEGIGVNFRVGALVEAVVPGTERYEASLKDVAWVEPSEVSVDLFNNGNLLIRPVGQIKIFDAGGKKVRQVELNQQRLGVLPKALRRFTTTVEEPLSHGSYRLKVEVDYGARTLIVGERSVEIR